MGTKLSDSRLKHLLQNVICVQVMPHSELSKPYGNRGYFVWVLLFIKKKIVESTESTRIMFESSGLIGKRA